MCAWGGINGAITVEMGTKADIDAAVREAITALGPDGVILSPVDNIRDPSAFIRCPICSKTDLLATPARNVTLSAP
jgi:hypothetical protein